MTGNEGLRQLSSRVVDLPRDDVDTDQIIPAAFLKTTSREGLARGLFATWRQDPDFVLNRPEATGARILLAGDNFGCGSSREHAVWALQDFGFRGVVSTGFSDIFRGNAYKNGLLAAEIDHAAAAELRAQLAGEPGGRVTLDLETCELRMPDGSTAPFRIDPFARICLRRGVDQLGYLLDQRPAIQAFEAGHRSFAETSGAAKPAAERS